MPRRPQMSSSSFGTPSLTPGVKALLALTFGVTVGIALLKWVAPGTADLVASLVSFTPGLFWRGRVWQPFTYLFFAPDVFSLLFAGLFLWMGGATLERGWGTKRFVWFYVGSGALAAFVTAVLALAWPRLAAFSYATPWPAQEAMVAAYAILMPDAQMLLYFFPVQARLMLPIAAGMTLLFIVMSGDPVPYIPSLFGLAAGVVLARGVRGPRQWWLRARVWWIERRMRNRRLRVVRGVHDDEDDIGQPRSGGRGSDRFLH